jgi:hypothetical protein
MATIDYWNLYLSDYKSSTETKEGYITKAMNNAVSTSDWFRAFFLFMISAYKGKYSNEISFCLNKIFEVAEKNNTFEDWVYAFKASRINMRSNRRLKVKDEGLIIKAREVLLKKFPKELEECGGVYYHTKK